MVIGATLLALGGVAVSSEAPSSTSLAVFGSNVGTAPASFAVSRTEGIVPFAVAFHPGDAWSFRDIEATRFEWSVNGAPFFTGFNAARVFETPGLHVVSVKAMRGTTVVAEAQVNITAQAPGRTLFVAAPPLGNDANPGTEAAPLATPERALNSAFGSYTPTRVLFRRGDTFTCFRQLTSNKPVAYRIGAYGTGARPIIQTNEEFLYASSNDLVISDLDLRGPGRGNQRDGLTGIELQGEHATVLRSALSRYANAIRLHGGAGRAQFLIRSRIADSVVYGMTSWGQTTILGNTFVRAGMEHLLRVFQMRWGLIAGNRFIAGAGQKHQLKLHADAAEPSGRILIADNRFEQPGEVGWMVSVGPENVEERQKIGEVIVERNHWRGDGAIRTALQSRGADEVVVRNNLFWSVTNAIGASHGVPGFSTWNGWRVYNNSYYTASTDEVQFAGFAGGTRIAVHNNVAFAPNAVRWSVPLEFPSSSFQDVRESHNVWAFTGVGLLAKVGNALMTPAQWSGVGQGAYNLTGDPMFRDATVGDLHLLPGSPALNAAMPVEGAFEDQVRAPRPAPSDRGAYEMTP